MARFRQIQVSMNDFHFLPTHNSESAIRKENHFERWWWHVMTMMTRKVIYFLRERRCGHLKSLFAARIWGDKREKMTSHELSKMCIKETTLPWQDVVGEHFVGEKLVFHPQNCRDQCQWEEFSGVSDTCMVGRLSTRCTHTSGIL